MSDPAVTDPVVKPKRKRLQFGLGGMVLFVMFAGSAGLVVVRWEPWVIQSACAAKSLVSNGEHLIPPDMACSYRYENGGVTLRNVATKELLASIPEGQLRCEAKCSRFVTVTSEGAAQIRDSSNGRQICAIPFAIQLEPEVHFSSNGNFGSSYGKDGKLYLFDAISGKILCERKIELGHFQVLSNDGQYLISCLGGNEWNVLNAKTKYVTWLTPNSWFSISAPSPDSRFILVRDESGWGLWDINQVKKLRTLNNINSESYCTPEFSHDGRLIAAANESTVIVFDSPSGAEKYRLLAPDRVTCLTFSPDDERIFATSVVSSYLERGECPQLWNTQVLNSSNGQLRGTLTDVAQVTFSKNGSAVIGHKLDVETTWFERHSVGIGHFTRPEVWLAIIFGSLWLWRASVWWRPRKA